jgi:hypothetical protein
LEFSLSLYDALVAANVPPDKARSVVAAMEKDMSEKLATKTDIEILKKEIVNTAQGVVLRLGSAMVVGLSLLFAALKAFGH